MEPLNTQITVHVDPQELRQDPDLAYEQATRQFAVQWQLLLAELVAREPVTD